MAALTLSSIRLCALALGVALASPALADDVSVKLDAGSSFVIKDHAGTVERLRVDEATGNISRNGALFVHTTGTLNLFLGPGAGNAATTGYGRNSAFGVNALRSNTIGTFNSAFGTRALEFNTTGFVNSAFGNAALRNNTTGSQNAAFGSNTLSSNNGDFNSAFGSDALNRNTTGRFNSALGSGALADNTTGHYNTAIGFCALLSNTTGSSNSAVGNYALAQNTGSGNSAVGDFALRFNATGAGNVAVGSSALRHNTTGTGGSAVGYWALADNTVGSANSAIGDFALRSNTTGSVNSAVGANALQFNTVGSGNAAFGTGALFNNTSGNGNVAVGRDAGSNQTAGSDNIYLANEGVAGENGQIKIGIVGTHTQATIAGIHGNTSAGGIAVLVNPSGTLGTTTSSARLKQDVRDMGEASDVLMKLRPVTFRYREDAVGADEAKATQYGLIAEEVAEVAPELVAPDADGKPYSVKYHELPALLLNEVQQQERANLAQQRTIEKQAVMIEAQRLEMQVQQREHEKEIAALTSRLAQLEANARQGTRGAAPVDASGASPR